MAHPAYPADGAMRAKTINVLIVFRTAFRKLRAAGERELQQNSRQIYLGFLAFLHRSPITLSFPAMRYCSVATWVVAGLLAVVSPATATPFTAVQVRSERAAAPMAHLAKRATVVIDDADPQITYSANWTHFNNPPNADYDGTESFCNDACCQYQFYSQGNYLSIQAGQKIDRGFFDVYLGDSYVGTGDAHSSCTSSCPSVTIFSAYLGTDTTPIQVTVRNRGWDSRLNAIPYLDVDSITFNT
ncbi:MAG: hypothetical protein CYPHOPRED_000292 [Cyphobasidiales sp. Tagirdzhanova-0007]|nr:MAG: hypothetical protein CYPHOPRED_000292 [Cyphobasidiales sp. Tagirdzhanova-0007]